MRIWYSWPSLLQSFNTLQKKNVLSRMCIAKMRRKLYFPETRTSWLNILHNTCLYFLMKQNTCKQIMRKFQIVKINVNKKKFAFVEYDYNFSYCDRKNEYSIIKSLPVSVGHKMKLPHMQWHSTPFLFPFTLWRCKLLFIIFCWH